MSHEINAVLAIIVGLVSIGLFKHFYMVKDGIARIMLLNFFGTIGVWALIRGITLSLYVHGIIGPLDIQAIVSYLHYLIYFPVIFSAIYLMVKSYEKN